MDKEEVVYADEYNPEAMHNLRVGLVGAFCEIISLWVFPFVSFIYLLAYFDNYLFRYLLIFCLIASLFITGLGWFSAIHFYLYSYRHQPKGNTIYEKGFYFYRPFKFKFFFPFKKVKRIEVSSKTENFWVIYETDEGKIKKIKDSTRRLLINNLNTPFLEALKENPNVEVKTVK